MTSPWTSFTLRQLTQFVAAAEWGTISRASAELHVSASAISASITHLERGLGAELCVRRKAQGLTLTPTGVEVLATAKRLLEQASELEHAVRGRDGELVGPLTVGCYATLAPTLLPQLMTGFEAMHPRVRVDVVESDQDRLLGALSSGEVDLAILYDRGLPSALERTVLARPEPYVVLSADNPLASRPALSLEELAESPMVLLDVPPSSDTTLSMFVSRGVMPQIRHRARSYEFARALVARTTAYAVLIQRPAVARSYEGLPLVTVPIVPAPDPVPVVIASLRGPQSSRARAFREFARTQIGM